MGDGITFTKVYTKNTYENVYFQNLLGDQTGSKYVNVSKIQPLGTLSYSTTALTSGDVTVTLTLAETGQILSPGRSGSGLIYTKTYTYDKTEEVRVKNVIRDREETLTVSISNIARILNYIGQSCATAPDIEFG
ncbi:MAG: hypothetical protein LBO09_07950 [Candidatus Peribacteria bacterium]|nr:hypothetical protein [Candidatus Peribacteria bacterium]